MTKHEAEKLKNIYLEVFSKLILLKSDYIDDVILGLEEYSLSLDNKIEGIE